MLCRMPDLPFSPNSASMPQALDTALTKLSNLCVQLVADENPLPLRVSFNCATDVRHKTCAEPAEVSSSVRVSPIEEQITLPIATLRQCFDRLSTSLRASPQNSLSMPECHAVHTQTPPPPPCPVPSGGAGEYAPALECLFFRPRLPDAPPVHAVLLLGDLHISLTSSRNTASSSTS